MVITTVARLTGAIRFHYHYIAENLVKSYRRRKYKYDIRGDMITRSQLIRDLRIKDYKQYEWMLEQLDLQYKPKPTKENTKLLGRRDGLRQLANEYCQDIKANKLENYRKQLHAEKIPYLEQKIKNLEFIRQEQKELKMPVTIQQENIDSVHAQLNALIAERDENKEVTIKEKWKAF